jgi:hypothetical protein
METKKIKIESDYSIPDLAKEVKKGILGGGKSDFPPSEIMRDGLRIG